MSFLQNASIKTKILSSLIPLCLVGMGAAGVMAVSYKNTDAQYSNYINTNVLAATYVARATTSMVTLPYTAYQLTIYDESEAAHEKIRDDYEKARPILFPPGKSRRIDAGKSGATG